MNIIIVFFTRIPDESTSNFQMFSLTHIISLIIIIAFLTLLLRYGHLLKSLKYENFIRILFGVSLIFTNINLWMYSYSLNMEWYHYLPVATCGYATFLGGLTLITKNKTLFKLTFFWGFGALLSLLGPTVMEGPEKYNFYQFFFRHTGIIASAFYMMKVYDYKIVKEDWKFFFYVTFSLTFIMTIINLLVNKPEELNMFYTMHPAVSGTPLNDLYEVSKWYYMIFWIPFAAFLSYLYGLPFYQKKELLKIE